MDEVKYFLVKETNAAYEAIPIIYDTYEDAKIAYDIYIKTVIPKHKTLICKTIYG